MKAFLFLSFSFFFLGGGGEFGNTSFNFLVLQFEGALTKTFVTLSS